MDAKRAKELIREYCAEKDAESEGSGVLKRLLRPIGLGLALGAMSLSGGACGDDNGPGPGPNDAYGITSDIAQVADAYGIPQADLPPADTVPQPADAYGISDLPPADMVPQPADAYGITSDVTPVADAYGIPDASN